MQQRSATLVKDNFTPFDYVPTSQSPLYYGESNSTADTIAAFHPHNHDHSIDSLPSFPPPATQPLDHPSEQNPIVLQTLLQELRSLAALESSIYLARTRTRPPLIALHTPARRLARTIVTFGVDEGVVFGLRALRAIEAVAEGCRDDVRGLCFWWSNCIQLRWMLWAMCGMLCCEGGVYVSKTHWVHISHITHRWCGSRHTINGHERIHNRDAKPRPTIATFGGAHI